MEPEGDCAKISMEMVEKFTSISTDDETNKQILKEFSSLKVKQHKKLRELFEECVTHKNETLDELFEQFTHITTLMKDVQASSLIVTIVYTSYKSAIMKRDPDGSRYKKAYANIWRCIPIGNLADFINSFDILHIIVSEDWTNISKTVKDLLRNGKLKDAAHYYTLFQKRDEVLERQEFLPKLIKGQDIYTPSVLNMLKFCPQLLDTYVNMTDPAVAIKVLELCKLDVRKYPKLVEYAERLNYKHHCKEFKDWFKMEERFGFSKKFIKWYAQEELEGELKESVLARIGVQGMKEIIKNPLFWEDSFTYTEEILKMEQKKCWKLIEHGITQEDVHFIDKIDDNFHKAKQILLNSTIVGFDSQYKATTSKYQNDGVSIIQLSAGKTIFLFDTISLQNNLQLTNFLQQLFNSNAVIKVGHTIKNDYSEMSKTFAIDKQKFCSFVDIAQIFKQKYPNEAQSSLSFITFYLTGQYLSKYQQRSNWNLRPLRKCQMHYAALDAYICQIIYLKLMEDVDQKVNKEGYYVQKNQVQQLVQQDNLCYGIEYQHFLKKPRFLVDNMLKRLATFLRNLGLDAAYLSVKDYNLAISIAAKEQRIILTKDKNFRARKNTRVPIYLIDSPESEDMTRQVVDYFKINMNQLDLLSRCVKCNNPNLVLMNRRKAIEILEFRYEDTNIKQFWQCPDCKQIYWEGHSYKNAKTRFSDFKKHK